MFVEWPAALCMSEISGHVIKLFRDRGERGAGRATAQPIFCLGLGLQDKYSSVQMHDEWRNSDP